jgi:VWFA-related protein
VEISNFYTTERGDRLLDQLSVDRAELLDRPALDRPAQAPPRRPLPEDQQLHLLVYVDHFNLRPADRQRVLGELEGFLEDRVIQGDRVMLVGYSGSLEVVHPFTEDRQQIRRGLDRLGKIATHRQVDDAERRRTMGWMSDAAANGDLGEAYQHLRGYVQVAHRDLRHSTEALRNVVRSLAGLPGRKALLYVSDGLPQRPGEELYTHLSQLFGAQNMQALTQDVNFVDPSIEAMNEDQGHLFNAITREANAHQVTFYTLDARGAFGDSSAGAEWNEAGAGVGGHLTYDNQRTFNLQEPLVGMAVDTGGEAILNTFNF